MCETYFLKGVGLVQMRKKDSSGGTTSRVDPGVTQSAFGNILLTRS